MNKRRRLSDRQLEKYITKSIDELRNDPDSLEKYILKDLAASKQDLKRAREIFTALTDGDDDDFILLRSEDIQIDIDTGQVPPPEDRIKKSEEGGMEFEQPVVEKAIEKLEEIEEIEKVRHVSG